MSMPARETDDRRHAPGLLDRLWTGVLDLALVLWVARSSAGLLAIGFLLLGGAPQAQDLLIPVVDNPWYLAGLFFPLVFLLWSAPTHYAAQLALDDDERLEQYRRRRRSEWLEALFRH